MNTFDLVLYIHSKVVYYFIVSQLKSFTEKSAWYYGVLLYSNNLDISIFLHISRRMEAAIKNCVSV